MLLRRKPEKRTSGSVSLIPPKSVKREEGAALVCPESDQVQHQGRGELFIYHLITRYGPLVAGFLINEQRLPN